MADDVLCAVKVVLCVPGCPHREALYDLRPGVPLCEHIASLFGNFFSARDEIEPPLHDPNDCALWTPLGHFLTDEEWEAGLPLKQSWVVEGCTLEFRLSPRREAGTIVSRLKQGDVKAAVHELKTSLMQLHFAEAFIERGGVAALLQIATEQAERPATQAYALQALRTATCWELGTQKLLKAGGAAKLVRLLHSDSLRAVGAALELLAALVAVKFWTPSLQGAAVRLWIDNEAARFGLIRGSSPVEVSRELITWTWGEISMGEIYPWFERVPSSGNPADDPSRGVFEWLLANDWVQVDANM